MRAVKCGLLLTCLNVYLDTIVSISFFRINSVSENRYFNNSKGLFDWLLTNNLSSLIMFSILQQHAILHHSNSDR